MFKHTFDPFEVVYRFIKALSILEILSFPKLVSDLVARSFDLHELKHPGHVHSLQQLSLLWCLKLGGLLVVSRRRTRIYILHLV